MRFGLKPFGVVLAAVMVGLASASCTGEDPPAARTTPATPGGATAPSLTFEEAYRKIPMDGTRSLPITWELSGIPDVEAVLGARRALVFRYWELNAIDWTSVNPIGRFVYTERYYQEILAPFATSKSDNPSIGPMWVKVMGVENNSADQVTVTFCADLGYWHDAKQINPKVRKDRENLESYVMQNVQSDDGERHWRADRLHDRDRVRAPKYGAECTKWSQHRT